MKACRRLLLCSALRLLQRSLRSLWYAATVLVRTVLAQTSTEVISLAVSRPLFTAATQHVLSDVSDVVTALQSASSEPSLWIQRQVSL